MDKRKKLNLKNLKIPLVVLSIIAVFLISAIVVPVASEGYNAASRNRSLTYKPTSIAMTFSSSDFQVGKNVHAEGVLVGSTGIYDARIALKVTLPDGTVTYPVQGSMTWTATGGKFSMDYVPTVAGKHTFTATFNGDYTYAKTTKSASFTAAAQSTPVTPSKSASTTSLTLASSSIETGKSMHADGILKGSAAIAGATVSLQVTLPDGSVAYPTQGSSTVTDSSGKFSMDYVPTTVGTYKFTATFAGNTIYDGSSVSASLAATSPATPSTPPTSTSYKYIVTNVGGTYYAKDAVTGATLTSGTNAATVINYAISHLTTGRTTKEAVLLQGDFTLTGAIAMKSYTSLQATGKITMAGSTTMISCYGITQFEIIGGEWDGKGVAQNLVDISSSNNGLFKDMKVHSGTYNCIAAINSKYLTFTGCDSYDNTGSGIGLVFTSDCTIENCHIYDVGSGIYCYAEDDGKVQDISNMVIRGNTIERTFLTGIEAPSLRGAEDIGKNYLIENNICIDCGTDGDHTGIRIGWSYDTMLRYAQNCIVRNNLIYETGAYQCGGGISCEAKDSSVTGNTVRNTYDYALIVRGDRNTISGNTFTGCGQYYYPSVLILDGNYNEITDNTFSASANGGVVISHQLTSGSNYNHIANNRITDMGSYTVYISAAGETGNTVEYNTFVGTSTIYNKGTSSVIRGNTIGS